MYTTLSRLLDWFVKLGFMEWVTCSSISGWDGVTCSRHGSVTVFYVIDGMDRHFCVQVESHASYANTG